MAESAITSDQHRALAVERQAQVAQRRDRHRQLTLAAVDHQEVGRRPRRIVAAGALEPPRQHLVHRREVVVARGLDLERAVQREDGEPEPEAEEAHGRAQGPGCGQAHDRHPDEGRA